MDKNRLSEAFLDLVEVVHELREKCPWDREQTKESLRHLTIEETYELSEAVLKDDWNELKVEAGDLLLHILFYARLGEEQGAFDTPGMMDALREKLIRRHPHIYGDVQAENSEKVIRNWEEIKMKEQAGKQKKRVLGGVPGGLPALIKAMRIQEKARNVGFDWEEPAQVWDKVKEELGELEAEVNAGDGSEGQQEKIEKEFGDLLFSLVNYARFIGVNPEDALERTNQKFKSRFEYLEDAVDAEGKALKEMSLEEMDRIWERSKSAYP